MANRRKVKEKSNEKVKRSILLPKIKVAQNFIHE